MEAIKGNMGQRGPSHFRFPHRLPLPVAGAPEISPSTRFTFDKWHRRAAGHAGPGREGHHAHRAMEGIAHHTHCFH